MKKTIRLTERDLTRIVKRVIAEELENKSDDNCEKLIEDLNKQIEAQKASINMISASVGMDTIRPVADVALKRLEILRDEIKKECWKDAFDALGIPLDSTSKPPRTAG